MSSQMRVGVQMLNKQQCKEPLIFHKLPILPWSKVREIFVFENGDFYLALLEFRNTLSEGDGVSPSKKLFSRRTRTCLPTTNDLLKPVVVDDENVMSGAERARQKRKNSST